MNTETEPSIVKDLFGNPIPSTEPIFVWPVKSEYSERCKRRWSGPALRDALDNWDDWFKLRAPLLRCMKQFHLNPSMQSGGKYYNPDATLSSMLWKMQEAWQPDKSSLFPMLDFEERFQKVFLRRGLFIYCQMLLEALP